MHRQRRNEGLENESGRRRFGVRRLACALTNDHFRSRALKRRQAAALQRRLRRQIKRVKTLARRFDHRAAADEFANPAVGQEIHREAQIDAADAVQARRVGELFDEGSRALFRAGAYFSRPYGMWSPLVFNADAETTAATRKVKAIFDPNNVMNPGKLCF